MTTTETPAATPERPYERLDGPVHEWFGLSYCNYQVIHRTLMQSMPLDWQRRMVACLEELKESFTHVPQPSGYEVNPCCWVAPSGMGSGEMALVGVTVSDPDSEDPTYYDKDGNELDPYRECVALPAPELVPHYNRGRTYIPPVEGEGRDV